MFDTLQHESDVNKPVVTNWSKLRTSKTSLSKPKQAGTGIHEQENAAAYMKQVKQESLDKAYSVVLFRNFGCLSSVLDVFYVRGSVICKQIWPWRVTSRIRREKNARSVQRANLHTTSRLSSSSTTEF